MLKLRMLLLLIGYVLILTACGKASQEDVVDKAHEKWNDTKGYEIEATMEVRTGAEPRTYDVVVWHTKPDFYRVTVKEQGEDVTQMIVRNEEGVFVVTPALQKSYKFQSDWPKGNSQAYLIGGLAEDLKEDKTATMTEQEDAYLFEVATRNHEKTALPIEQIEINKKTMLPTRVSLLNEALEEKVVVTFNEVKLGTKRQASEYAVEKFSEKEEKLATTADIVQKDFSTYYPTLNWTHTKLVDEKNLLADNNETKRVILTFEGEKPFTLFQQPALTTKSVVPVMSPGDLADLGDTIGAITDHSISWEKDGISFFIASTQLSREEMIEVAMTVSVGSEK
jgi:outer membrane lipoprotein-sorting protein